MPDQPRRREGGWESPPTTTTRRHRAARGGPRETVHERPANATRLAPRIRGRARGPGVVPRAHGPRGPTTKNDLGRRTDGSAEDGSAWKATREKLGGEDSVPAPGFRGVSPATGTTLDANDAPSRDVRPPTSGCPFVDAPPREDGGLSPRRGPTPPRTPANRHNVSTSVRANDEPLGFASRSIVGESNGTSRERESASGDRGVPRDAPSVPGARASRGRRRSRARSEPGRGIAPTARERRRVVGNVFRRRSRASRRVGARGGGLVIRRERRLRRCVVSASRLGRSRRAVPRPGFDPTTRWTNCDVQTRLSRGVDIASVTAASVSPRRPRTSSSPRFT